MSVLIGYNCIKLAGFASSCLSSFMAKPAENGDCHLERMDEFKNLQKRVGLEREKVTFLPINKNCYEWQTYGSSLLSGSVVTIPKLFQGKAQETAIMAHEFSHIKNEDLLWRTIYSVVISCASTLLFTCFTTVMIASCLGVAVAFVSGNWISQQQELRADSEACQYLTSNEKSIFMEFLEKSQKMLSEHSKKGVLAKAFVYWGTLGHPDMQYRIGRIQETMKQSVPVG